MITKKENSKWISNMVSRGNYFQKNMWIFAGIFPVFFPLQYRQLFSVFISSDSEILLSFLLCGCILAASLVGSKFFTKKERVTASITALCGAKCSECSYFLEGSCLSCPEGDSNLRETCSIFLCARTKGTMCSLCDRLSTCDIFAQKRDVCPFEEEFFPLQMGVGYVFYEKNPEKSVQLFKDYVNRGEFGLLISRQYPKQMKAKFNLENIESIWLSTAEGEDSWIDPNNLSKLHHVASNFLRNAPLSVVLFEGLEYLMVRNSFLAAVKFLQSLMDEIIYRKSRLILSINPEAFETRELALIRRELVEL